MSKVYKRENSRFFQGYFTDADGVVQRRSTGCTDKTAAEAILADWVKEEERIKAKLYSKEDIKARDSELDPLEDHLNSYLAFLKMKTKKGKATSEKHCDNVKRQLFRVAREREFRCLRDITPAKIRKWMTERIEEKVVGGRTINTHRSAVLAFCTWAYDEELLSKPIRKKQIPKADETEIRRNRRAFTEAEMVSLLNAAKTRPLVESLTIRRGKNKGKQMAKISEKTRGKQIILGEERRLIYTLMFYTGLRKNETATLLVRDLYLDAEQPHVEVVKRNTKNAETEQLPLSPEIANEFSAFLERKAVRHRESLGPNERLFRIPRDFIRVFDRDLKFAGIEKANSLGETLDIHCLRHTFATMLARAGVNPQDAQKLMRHTDINLTMGVYTHLGLIDKANAIQKLPNVFSATKENQAHSPRSNEEKKELCAEKCVENLTVGVQSCPSESKVHDRPQNACSTKSNENSPKKGLQSTVDRSCHTATEEDRTLNIQLGKLTLYH